MSKGFTLIELIIVIVIISAAAAILITGVSDWMSKSTTGLPQGDQPILQGK